MDNRKVKSEIMEKIGIDKIIDEQMEWKDPDALSDLDEKDVERIKRKLRAEVEQELEERMDQEIKEQIERKKQEQERREQLIKTVKKACSVVAAGAAVCCSVLLAVRILKRLFGKNKW